MKLQTLSVLVIAAFAAAAAEPDGAALYKERCATCHEGKPQSRMPSRAELGTRTPESVYSSMFGGSMAPQSAGLSEEEGRAIARFVTAKEFGTRVAEISGKCAAASSPVRISNVDWNGWGVDAANTRYQPRPGLNAADVPQLKLKW